MIVIRHAVTSVDLLEWLLRVLLEATDERRNLRVSTMPSLSAHLKSMNCNLLAHRAWKAGSLWSFSWCTTPAGVCSLQESDKSVGS
jgi:hypothetical protein